LNLETLDLKTLGNFFQTPRKIIDNNKILKKEKYEKGGMFNIFSILGFFSQEVSFHSKFISELLNPKGSHGTKEKFLELFCKQINFQEFPCRNAKVSYEKHIGIISEDYEKGGRLDIVIKAEDNTHIIVIENKIYASDQPCQLLRYKNYIRDLQISETNSRLLYLTLGGYSPSESSVYSEKSQEEKYWDEISYLTDITTWINQCIEDSSSKPQIKEVLLQYLEIIKQLTGQDMEKKMSNEIIDFLMNDNNLEIATELSNYISQAKIKIFNEKIIPLLDEYAKETNLTLKIREEGLGEKNCGVIFYKENNSKWENLSMGLLFEGNNFQNFYCGISRLDDKKPWDMTIYNKLEAIPSPGPISPYCPLWNEIPEVPYNGIFPLKCFTEPEWFVENIKKTVNEFISIIDDEKV